MKKILSEKTKEINEKYKENKKEFEKIIKCKYVRFLIEIDNKQLLKKISDAFPVYLDERIDEDDLKMEDENKRLRNYFDTNVEKYFKRIENFYLFLIALKEEKINIIYEEATYISDVEMGKNSEVKEKIIPTTVKKTPNKKQKLNLNNSPEISKRRKDFKF